MLTEPSRNSALMACLNRRLRQIDSSVQLLTSLDRCWLTLRRRELSLRHELKCSHIFHGPLSDATSTSLENPVCELCGSFDSPPSFAGRNGRLSVGQTAHSAKLAIELILCAENRRP